MQKLSKLIGFNRTEARSKICYKMTSHARSQPVVKRIGQSTSDTCLTPPITRANCHVVSAFNLFQHSRYIVRIMLTISVHEDKHIALRSSGSTFDGCSVPHGVGGT